MSVSLYIEKINGEEKNEYLPVSGQKFFEENWMPLCELLNLKWIPLFKTGFTFNEDDLPDILEELNLLKRQCDQLNNEHLKNRLGVLIDRLEGLRGQTTSFFIG
jgi:hypothetical protein